ncbi:early nodulin-like protein 2 [Cynara cardunculus var. scolymus]|uniref:Cupredoxin n=1 Tax=Cynara cardunculus var. scolymus TaxID=59895 RepID=A0A124SHS6_CYNCS|nr:early nodulin-like protein 2 [Cynara cardunculus var. scolymus]KVI10471.1 Cupredoxin [Cynara cardunculus var. scolymus]
MESFHKTLCIFFTFFFALLSSSRAYTFNVGGRDGWTLHPSENYNQWSGRLRFIVNDALHFKYNGGSDSVLEVNNGDYDNCNTKNPITKLAGGDSYFTLNRSGPFYFISGNKSNCDQGQKLNVVVISPKTKSSPPPAGVASPPTSFSPIPSEFPISAPPQPGTTIPASPASSPGGTGSGGSSSPASSPDGSDSFSPAGSPASSPGVSDSSSPAGSPASSPIGNPADINAPPPSGSSSEKLAASAILTFPLAIIIFGFGSLH